MAGGGVTSDHDPLDSTQYTEAELRAAADAADAWNTYVTVHAYTPKAIRMPDADRMMMTMAPRTIQAG